MAELNIPSLLAEAFDTQASDLHVKAGRPPLFRRAGRLVEVPGFGPLTPEGTDKAIREFLTQDQENRFDECLDLDFAGDIAGVTRYRASVLRQRGSLEAIFRLIPEHITTLEGLQAPPILSELAQRPRGLILVTGPTGSGKSTTQAAIVDYINRRKPVHIMTVEDPIEFIHEDRVALINQREIGSDTDSFANALKYVLRQDPDVILIGEMRDPETIALGITAAETGHLVIGTLHTLDAVSSIDRIIDGFPPSQQNQVRIQLANNLLGVCSQHLLNASNGERRAAFETLVATQGIKALIRVGKSHQLRSHVQMGAKFGMQTLEQHLAKMVEEEFITPKIAHASAQNDDDMERALLKVTSGRRGSQTH